MGIYCLAFFLSLSLYMAVVFAFKSPISDFVYAYLLHISFSFFTDIKLDPNLKGNITKCKAKFDATMATLDLHYLEYTKYTKKYVKSQKFSPDSLMQLAIQVSNEYSNSYL